MVPSLVLKLYGVEYNPATLLMVQYAGLGSLAIGLVAWFIRNVTDSLAKRAIIPAFLITYTVGVIVSVSGTLSGILKIGCLLLALAYAYILILQKK